MSKEKITISVDERILEIMDRQRGDTKRSTYINAVLEEYFQPRSPEEKGGGTFVTTLELRKTLKAVHDRLSMLEALDTTVRDLEALVYETLYDVKDRTKIKVKKGGSPSIPYSVVNEEAVKAVDQWIEENLKKHGSIVIDRDLSSYLQLDGVEKSVIGLTRHLRRNGLEYDEKKKRWL